VNPTTPTTTVAPTAAPCSNAVNAVSAVILAAGRGERMRPLTDATPKPLLTVHGQPLLRWHVEALASAGYTQLHINTAWLGEQIPSYFGPQPSSLLGVPLQISYSHEGVDFGGALETAGGIARLLPALSEVFWVLAGDVYVPGFVFKPDTVADFAQSKHLAHLFLVPNPAHNPKGDFGLGPADEGAQACLNLPADHPGPRYTYSTIGLYKRALFEAPWCDIPAGNPQGIQAALAPLLRRAMDAGLVSAELYSGAWTDVGTPERLAQLNASPLVTAQSAEKR
jgi:MurNAc alpha-1-phosphate uridylyltransferase